MTAGGLKTFAFHHKRVTCTPFQTTIVNHFYSFIEYYPLCVKLHIYWVEGKARWAKMNLRHKQKRVSWGEFRLFHIVEFENDNKEGLLFVSLNTPAILYSKWRRLSFWLTSTFKKLFIHSNFFKPFFKKEIISKQLKSNKKPVKIILISNR